MHQLELLPGLGKKHMWEIIEARREDPFKSFADLKARVKLMPDPEKLVAKRILQELEGMEKHYIFVEN
jgi:putative nucleotide binding protein